MLSELARQNLANPQWEAGLPNRIRGLAEDWGLTDFSDPLPGGGWSLVLACSYQGRSAVLKLCPDPSRLAPERAALRAWAGIAPSVLCYDFDATLMERIDPCEEVESMTIEDQAALLNQLHRKPVPGLWQMEDFVERRMIGRIEAVSPRCSLARELQQEIYYLSQGRERLLCHGDIYSANLLRDEQGVRVIDPFGVSAPLEFEVACTAVNYSRKGWIGWSVHELCEASGADIQLALPLARLYCLLQALHHTHRQTEFAYLSPDWLSFAEAR